MRKRPLRSRGKPENERTNIQLLRLIICAAILGAVLLLRISKPDEVKTFINDNISKGSDAGEAVALIGEKIKEVFKLAPPPQLAEETAGPAPVDGMVSPQPTDHMPPEVDLEPEELQNSPTPGAGVGEFQILFLEDGFLPSDIDNETDDTLPLPFGLEKPEKADYTIYTLPFKTQIPVDGTESSGFGYRTHPVAGEENTFHYGVDIAAPKGTAVKPFADGTVALTGNSKSYGLYLMIKHEDGYVTLYAHCSKVLVKTGQKVTMKDTVAKVGNTGVATGYHLHLELRKGNSLLNPSYYIDIPQR